MGRARKREFDDLFTIKATALLGTDLDEAVDGAIRLTREIGLRIIDLNFNGVVLLVAPDSNPDFIKESYRNRIRLVNKGSKGAGVVSNPTETETGH